MSLRSPFRHLILVLGDQLDLDSAAFDGFDAEQDTVWMAEVAHESTKVWSTKPRIGVFLAAMRHFRDVLQARGWHVCYRELTADSAAMESEELSLEMREDRHFLCSHPEFAAHAEGRKQLRMEFFHREMRKRQDALMDDGQPTGGDWNFDSENRKSFGKDGPPMHKTPRSRATGRSEARGHSKTGGKDSNCERELARRICCAVQAASGWGERGECYAISDHCGSLAWSACENHKPGRVAAGHTVMVASSRIEGAWLARAAIMERGLLQA